MHTLDSVTVLGSMVLIARTPADTELGVLSLSSSSTTPRSSGVVLKVGQKVSPLITVNSTVVVDTTQLTTITIEDTEYIMVKDTAIIGIIEDSSNSIIPLGSRVLLSRSKSDTTMGSLLISDSGAIKKSTGTILALGTDVTELSVGDLVIFDKYGETTLSHGIQS